MLFLSKPSRNTICEFIDAQKDQKFSYSHVGETQKQAPDNYAVDRNRIQLGSGTEDYARAKSAIRQWTMFNMPWINLCWPDTSIEIGATVAVLISHFGFWSLNSCRIVYVIDGLGEAERYGFAYGTLPGHEELGEERFTVEYHPADKSVWYDIYAFSRPGPLARLAYPLARTLQKRFAKESQAAMLKAMRAQTR